MRLILDPEQEELRRAVRDLLGARSAPAQVREQMLSPDGHDRALWQTLGELGLLGLAVPEKFGGSGGGHVERSIVLEELGSHLTPTPFLASAVLATDALLALGDATACSDLLPKLAAGEALATLAVAEPGSGPWPTDGGNAVAEQRDGYWELDGTKSHVLFGHIADVVVVYARTSDGPGWFIVEAGALGLASVALESLDPTRRLARLTFSRTPARRIPTIEPEAVLTATCDLAGLALAAEQVGVMRRATELTVEYAKLRVQFGRQIGSYQAVKHGCADMFSASELAISLLRYGTWVADNDPTQLGLVASLLQTYVGEACFDVTAAMIHYHGGIGYTWEHDAHLFYKRAKSSQLLLGSVGEHKARLADHLGF